MKFNQQCLPCLLLLLFQLSWVRRLFYSSCSRLDSRSAESHHTCQISIYTNHLLSKSPKWKCVYKKSPFARPNDGNWNGCLRILTLKTVWFGAQFQFMHGYKQVTQEHMHFNNFILIYFILQSSENQIMLSNIGYNLERFFYFLLAYRSPMTWIWTKQSVAERVPI